MRLDLDHLFSRLQRRRATYFVGAGASAPVVPFGEELDWKIIRGHILSGRFRPVISAENPATRRIIGRYSYLPGLGPHPVYGREVRAGTDDNVPALLKLLGAADARMRMIDELSQAKQSRRQLDGYRIFRAFHPGLIMSFNVDGFVADVRGSEHWVVEVHGSIATKLGEPNGIILDEPEHDDDPVLLGKLLEIWRTFPECVVIIGYTFGRKDGYHDDWVSLNEFTRRYRQFRGDIFVVDPEPHSLREVLADNLASPNVYAVPAYWNILARAFIEKSSGRGAGQSLMYRHELILDKCGPGHGRD
jgi:hypothetical protein